MTGVLAGDTIKKRKQKKSGYSKKEIGNERSGIKG
jgi:hypothetical protein